MASARSVTTGGAENVVREETGVAREGVRARAGFPRARPAWGPRADSIRRVSGPERRKVAKRSSCRAGVARYGGQDQQRGDGK